MTWKFHVLAHSQDPRRPDGQHPLLRPGALAKKDGRHDLLNT
jgi:hypothetical protein